MFKKFGLFVLILCHVDVVFALRLPNKKGLFITGSDITKDSQTMVVAGYGKGACDGKGDGILIYESGDILPILVHSVCGLYFRSSMEAITIVNEDPLTTVVTAEQYKKVFKCVHHLKEGFSDCRSMTAEVLGKKDLKESSGIDTDSEGNMFIIADNTRWLFKVDQQFNELARYKLPEYLNQAEDLDVSSCNDSTDCVFIADVGKGGTDRIHVLDLMTMKWSKFRVKKKNQRADSEAFSMVQNITYPYHAMIIYKDRRSTVDIVELIPEI